MASFVVEADAKVVGMAATSPNRDDDTPYSAELLMIYLALGYWRRGIGQKLMHATTTWLIGQGMASMIVWGLAENWPARRFYEALGGQYFGQRSTDIAGSPLPEVSYDWTDITMLAIPPGIPLVKSRTVIPSKTSATALLLNSYRRRDTAAPECPKGRHGRALR